LGNVNNLPGCFRNRRGYVEICSFAGGLYAGISGITASGYARTGKQVAGGIYRENIVAIVVHQLSAPHLGLLLQKWSTVSIYTS